MADTTKSETPPTTPTPTPTPAAPVKITATTDIQADLIAKQLAEAAADQQVELDAAAALDGNEVAPEREPKEGKAKGTKFDYYKLLRGKHRYTDTNGDWVVVASGTPAAEEVPLTTTEFDHLRDRFTFVRKGE